MTDRTPLHERCRGRWAGIIAALGLLSTRQLNGKAQPCPQCGGRDRWVFDDKEGTGSFLCRRCGAGYGTELVMRLTGWDFKAAAERIESVLGEVKMGTIRRERTDGETKSLLKSKWGTSGPMGPGGAMWAYLTRRCGEVPVTKVLRQRPVLIAGTTYVAMVAAIQDVDGRMCGLHETYLTQAGEKANVDPQRRVHGKMPEGCAIRLMPIPDDTMGVAEGIETAFSAAAMFGVPTWATVCDIRMAVFSPPEGVQRVLVFGDCDASYAGQTAAYGLARRLESRGINAEVHIPGAIGTDWNDVWRERRQNGVSAVTRAEELGKWPGCTGYDAPT
jgi:putative DNA primase/helicase